MQKDILYVSSGHVTIEPLITKENNNEHIIIEYKQLHSRCTDVIQRIRNRRNKETKLK
jgi:hypothetical protein